MNENEEKQKLDFDDIIFRITIAALIIIMMFLCVNFGADGVKLSILIVVAFFSIPQVVALVLWGGAIAIILFKLLSIFVGLF